MTVQSRPGRRIFAVPSPVYNFSVRHFALERVERLVLVKDNGVGVTHGGGHQTYHIDRR